MLGVITDTEGLVILFVLPVIALREFLLCEKQKAKAFSSCQSPSFVVPGNQASSSTCCLQKITAKELLLDLFKKPEIYSRTGPLQESNWEFQSRTNL